MGNFIHFHHVSTGSKVEDVKEDQAETKRIAAMEDGPMKAAAKASQTANMKKQAKDNMNRMSWGTVAWMRRCARKRN